MPGTDLALALGAAARRRLAGGYVDEAYLEARTTGFEAVRPRPRRGGQSGSSALTGVTADDVRALGRLLGRADAFIVLTARGAEQHTQGTDTVLGLDQPRACPRPARQADAGYGCLTGQGNGQGGREHGQKADQLPGYRMIDDPAARAHVAACGE